MALVIKCNFKMCLITIISTELSDALFVHRLYQHASSFLCCETSEPHLADIKGRQSTNCVVGTWGEQLQ